MITKERLEELIDIGATIYTKHATDIKQLNFEYYNNSKNWHIGYNDLSLEIKYSDIFAGNNYSWYYDLENLYEHKADAEWDLEFENVEKRIKFVKPKPFREVEGIRNQTVYDAHGLEMYIGENNIFICTGFLFEKPFTEENYTEACRLIKKLFMEE